MSWDKIVLGTNKFGRQREISLKGVIAFIVAIFFVIVMVFVYDAINIKNIKSTIEQNGWKLISIKHIKRKVALFKYMGKMSIPYKVTYKDSNSKINIIYILNSDFKHLIRDENVKN